VLVVPTNQPKVLAPLHLRRILACSALAERPPRTGALHGRRGPGARTIASREASGNRGDLAEALERQDQGAAPADLTGGGHRRRPGRADVPAGHGNRPMVGFVASALPSRDIDGIDPVGILGCRQCGLRIRGVYRGRSRENGGEKT
jgi:hypothetical protein